MCLDPAAPRKFSIWGEGGWLAKKETGIGKPRSESMVLSGHRWVSQGEGKSRRLEEGADPGAEVREENRAG